MRQWHYVCGLALALILVVVGANGADTPAAPAYQILLRSRIAEATPHRTRDAQTGGGSIEVDQPEANTIVITLAGAAGAASQCHQSAAGMSFCLEQDVEVIANRAGVRPPRIGLVGRVLGTLQVTEPGWCSRSCGTAEQGPATACLSMGETNLLSICVRPTCVACGQESSINFRDGPVDAAAGVGLYRLCASFRFGVTQGKGCFHRQYAIADFDPAPQFDAAWADGLKPFRAIPRRDFGFRIVLRVIEDFVPVTPAAK